MEFKEILYNFFPDKQLKEVKSFGNGHINSTFKVIFKNNQQEYILQKINTTVFNNPDDLIQNHIKVQEYIKNSTSEIEIPQLYANSDNKFLLKDNESNVWRLTNFIENSYSIDVLENEKQAFEAGAGFGWFVKSCSGLNPTDFREAIKDFHRLSFRISQLDKAIESDKAKRFTTVKSLIDFYKKRENSLMEIEKLIDNHEIPLRVVHNDTKINNLLFRNEKAVAVIDLDTVGPGVIFYDYGDAIRTIGNTVAEDEKNIDLVDFNLKAFESFSKGYLQQIASSLNDKEKELLYRAPILMTYIMGIRFLADYLNGDIYYKTKYPDHNLSRSLVQKRYIELMEQNEDQMKLVIQKFKD
ncbi:MAG: phosphotransferase [Bacteroidales bacterium]|nr:phosphotransferase [Bacteroidales bacterium]